MTCNSIEYKYDFSFVIAVYNVEEYIDEAMQSLFTQDFPQNRLQFILVDDGSTDGSGLYCDRIKERYPESTVVIHKPNGGLASARMAGIPYIEGKYVSFVDPDDKISRNMLKEVYRFFEAHQHETEVVSVPLYYFGASHGQHPLNDKFVRGSRMIDLKKEWNALQLSVASAFYRRETVLKMMFDTALVAGEDAKENIRILIRKQTLGVVANVEYYYRVRKQSLIQTVWQEKDWYLTCLSHLNEWAVSYCHGQMGYVPKFVQGMLLHHLAEKYNQPQIPGDLLSEAEKAEYIERLFALCRHFDDDVILENKEFSQERLLFLFSKKYMAAPNMMRCNDARTYYGYPTAILGSFEKLRTSINIIEVKQNCVHIEGSQFCPVFWKESLRINLLINGQRMETQKLDYDRLVRSAGIEIAGHYGFKADFSLEGHEKVCLKVETEYGDTHIFQGNFVFGRYAPVSLKLRHSYAYQNGYMITPEKNGIVIEKANRWEQLKKELHLDCELLTSKKRAYKKAAVARMAVHICRLVLPKDIWLVADRANRADDNGEAFFKFLAGNKDKQCHPIFAVGKETPDYKRLKKIGTVIPYMSLRHKILHLVASHTISAYSRGEISSPFFDYSCCYADLLQRNKVVFLQHGITHNDVSNNLNRFNKNYALLVTSTKRERQSILEYNYGYDEDQIILTGFPRYDYLYNRPEKKITIMPTWLKSLFGIYNSSTGKYPLLPGFEKSEYYLYYNEMLNSPKLLNAAKEYGYSIQFVPHPVIMPYVDYFKPDPSVEVKRADVCYREVFAESSLIVTDYSSTVFDFAYLNKPIIYSQKWKLHYEKGYFDYERDGFGEVVHTLEETVDLLVEYMKNGCELKPKYRQRIDNFFAFRDRNNSQRVYDSIIQLDKKNKQ